MAANDLAEWRLSSSPFHVSSRDYAAKDGGRSLSRRRTHLLSLPNCDAVVYGPPLGSSCDIFVTPRPAEILST